MDRKELFRRRFRKKISGFGTYGEAIIECATRDDVMSLLPQISRDAFASNETRFVYIGPSNACCVLEINEVVISEGLHPSRFPTKAKPLDVRLVTAPSDPSKLGIVGVQVSLDEEARTITTENPQEATLLATLLKLYPF